MTEHEANVFKSVLQELFFFKGNEEGLTPEEWDLVAERTEEILGYKIFND